MLRFRHLETDEIRILESHACQATDWNGILVDPAFKPDHIFSTRFSGEIRLGRFEKEIVLPGGMRKHTGLYHTTLHNVSIGDDCCIENVKNYIANYDIAHDCFIENVDIILTDGVSSFGNGVQVAVMNETGGREVAIYDRLSAQQAYVMALYRHRTGAVNAIQNMIHAYADSISSDRGSVGAGTFIVDTGYIKNVRIGQCCKIEGASRLRNGSICSNETAPVHIGVGVIADDFIIASGSSVEDGVTLERCFVGQSCKLGHTYSASDSLFFSNCQGENGEACAIFAGPFTVTHHKSTLLIAGMFSFMNAGSGSNQSNHMYKLGPIHQGIMERGAKTSSDSYILWPAKVGAFSLVMGRHDAHQDTSDLPFSYLIEQQNTTFIMPGANLRSVGTIRDAKKWPKRDSRKDPDKLDCINYNLLSPYTIQKMLNATALLKRLQKVSGENSETYSFQSGKIKRTSLKKGLRFYGLAIDKFLGNSLISRIKASKFSTLEELRAALVPSVPTGSGDWVDMAGLIAPKTEVTRLLDDLENGRVKDVKTIEGRFADMHANYYEYEWTWAYDVFKSYYGIDLSEAGRETLIGLIHKWKDSVVELDGMLLEDARKEFSLSAMTSFGADGSASDREEDFQQVRGATFEKDPFVCSIREHITVKSELAGSVFELLDNIN